MMSEPQSIFHTKYQEFATELLATFPELSVQIHAAIALTPQESLQRFRDEVKHIASADTTATPGTVLPGVSLPDNIWKTLSSANQGAIVEYVKLLSMCCFLEGGFSDGSAAPTQPWMEDMMGQWKDKLSSVDFEGIMGKFSKIFGAGAGVGEAGKEGDKDASGSSGFKMPSLPEKFLKGHLAKLAEEIVRDIKPEDIGLTPQMVEECEKSPSRAFDILIQVFTRNPGIIQDTVKRIGKRLQQKVQSGQIRPQEIAREAEEMMKEFASNPEFVELMESLKASFGFEDMDMARQAGREGSARLSIVQQRLRKKLDARKAKNGSAK